MDTGAWRATIHGVTESNLPEQLTLTLIFEMRMIWHVQNDSPGTVTALASLSLLEHSGLHLLCTVDLLFTLPRILVSAPHLLLHSWVIFSAMPFLITLNSLGPVFPFALSCLFLSLTNIFFKYVCVCILSSRAPPPSSLWTLWLSDVFTSLSQSAQSLSCVWLFATPWTTARQASLSITNSHVCWVSDAIQPSHPLSSPSPPALNLSQHHGLFQWVSSSHQVAKVLEFQLQHQSFQWTPRTDLL